METPKFTREPIVAEPDVYGVLSLERICANIRARELQKKYLGIVDAPCEFANPDGFYPGSSSESTAQA